VARQCAGIPTIRRSDISGLRDLAVGRANVEFRWDAFNLFNHPGFGFPNQNFDSPTAGRITSTVVDNRSMQFSLKFNF